MNYHVVIRLPWQDISGYVIEVFDVVPVVAIADHSPDEDTKTAHIHILAFGCPGTEKNNPLRDKIKSRIPGYDGKKHGSWATTVHKTKEPVDLSGGLQYILKGGDESRARLVYQKNIPAQSVEAAKEAWVEYSSETAKLSSSQRAWKECWELVTSKGFTKDTPATKVAAELNDLLNDIGYDFRMSYRSGIINQIIAKLKPVYKAELVKRLIIPKPEYWGDEPW